MCPGAICVKLDRHEFCVVETIEFTQEDENIPLAAPIDVTTGAPQGAPVPLDGSTGTVFAEAAIDKSKGNDSNFPGKSPGAITVCPFTQQGSTCRQMGTFFKRADIEETYGNINSCSFHTHHTRKANVQTNGT